ncbi:hypothetical protein ACIHDR_46835 [Nocardia sp. NPDC052278]|uniref:hypothetical protein n=1 Tax=unclassified Nocardia TaxID=2637762 RepID=UPI00369B95E5
MFISDQTITETTEVDIHGAAVLIASGPVTGLIALGYNYYEYPRGSEGAWYLRIQLAPHLPAEHHSSQALTAAVTVDGVEDLGSFSYLWLAPHPDPTPVGDNLNAGETPRARDGSASPRPDSRSRADVTNAIAGLHRVVLEQWHTPQRLQAAKIAFAQSRIDRPAQAQEAGSTSAEPERTRRHSRVASRRDQQP